MERGAATESWHLGAAAATTPDGGLVAGLGDPLLATFLRSAAKPFQALPLLESGGRERFDLAAADIALICASHAGTEAHVRRAAALLERGGFGPEDVQCGAHPPYDEESRRSLLERGESPGALHNNCSGKHAGMLLACRQLGLPTDDYLDPHHPLQQRILSALAELCGLEADQIGIGVDGCSAPCFHLPLAAAARGYAVLAAPDAVPLDDCRRRALATIVDAMTGVAAMVSGPGRFTTRLMEVSGGRLLGKEGAEGVYAVAIRGPVALGLALKVADGGERCRDGVVLEALRQLGVLSGAELEELAGFYRPELRNHAGRVVGRIVPELELDEVAT